jgi:hypothetical protein
MADCVTLVSPLPREECVRRLRERAAPMWTMYGSLPVAGRIEETGFHIHQRRRMKNSFRMHLWASLEQWTGQTCIRCRFGMNPFAEVFLILWVGLVLSGLAVTASSALTSLVNEGNWENTWIVLPPLAMLGFGYGLVRFGKYIARCERAFLLEFLRETLDARPLSD